MRRVPVRTYKIEYEDQVERVPVQVQRVIPEQRIIEYEQKVSRYVPYVTDQIVAKTVMMREPLPDDYSIVTSTPRTISSTYVYEDTIGEPIIVGKPVDPEKLELNASNGKPEVGEDGDDNEPEVEAESDPNRTGDDMLIRGEKPVVHG